MEKLASKFGGAGGPMGGAGAGAGGFPGFPGKCVSSLSLSNDRISLAVGGMGGAGAANDLD